MKLNRLLVLHLQPIEAYPPVLNLLKYFSRKFDSIIVITSNYEAPHNKFEDSGITIIRVGPLRGLNRVMSYLKTLFYLLKYNPEYILYYETISSFPIVFYQYLRKQFKLYIHYHEISLTKDFKGKINKWMRNLELSLLNQAIWISQTNEFRKKLFMNDTGVEADKCFVMPNYPSESWRFSNNVSPVIPVKMVYVGYDLNPETMFVWEIMNFLLLNKSKVSLDIYTVKNLKAVEAFMNKHNLQNVSVKGNVAYNQLNKVLSTYQIGIILYKGNTINYQYNAPNKLFEYLASGLDVWFPDTMTGTIQYERLNEFPKIIALNFEKLDELNIDTLIDRTKLNRSEEDYRCEPVYKLLLNHMSGSNPQK